jgi:thiamine pyrophosphokinase
MLLGNGPYTKNDFKIGLSNSSYVIAADGGANAAHREGVKAKFVIGDMDSVSAKVKAFYNKDELYEINCQENTDLEKCLRLSKAAKLIGIGFLVKFPEQTCILIGSRDICFLCPSLLSIKLPIGTRFSVFPMSSIEGTSEGLKYPIDNLVLNPTKKIGTSNEVVSKVKLSFNHRSAIIILPKKYLTNVLEVL